MEIPKILLDHTNLDETSRMDRLELLLLLAKEKTSFAINLNGYWLYSIYDHKGELTFKWNYWPHQIVFDIIDEIWESRFYESKTQINHEFHTE